MRLHHAPLKHTHRTMDDVNTIEKPTHLHVASRWRSGSWQKVEDELAEEVPVSLEYNGISHAVMLTTPSNLEEFALGFSLSEGIVASPKDCYAIDVEYGTLGITLHITISNASFVKLKERRRNLVGRTGCGLCGTESLEQVLRPLPKTTPNQQLSAKGIRCALNSLRGVQPLNRLTGGTHAAVWCKPDGEVCAGFEDIGRHNALDKLIGRMAKANISYQEGFVLITSRASFEMVQKAATMRIPALVAISAPTALAVRTAKDCGMTLVAFARGEDFVCYANCTNIKLE